VLALHAVLTSGLILDCFMKFSVWMLIMCQYAEPIGI